MTKPRYPANNPYRYGIYSIWDRLKWDFNPESWNSRTKIKSWKDRYLGQKAVILCNGPSLLKCNFANLEGVFTFGLNKINLLFDKSNFRPSAIVAVNSYVIDQNSAFFNETSIPLFLDQKGLGKIVTRPNTMFLHSSSQFKLARDCSMSVYQGGTVTFVAMQLAFHMGFKDLALVGCDHNFSTKGPSNAVVTSGAKDENHFDPNYFAGGIPWQLPDLLKSELVYTLAKDVFQDEGRRIVNATEGGMLEVFPRMELSKFLQE